MDQEYLTIDDTALRLGVHPKTIRRYINSGKLSAQKVAGAWRIYEQSIADYLTGCGVTHHQGHVSQDDFCVFMDSDYFESDDPLQLCTIVDYYIQGDCLKRLLQEVMDVVASDAMNKNKSRFNYVYDDSEHRMRLVFWGRPSYMEAVMGVLKHYESLPALEEEIL